MNVTEDEKVGDWESCVAPRLFTTVLLPHLVAAACGWILLMSDRLVTHTPRDDNWQTMRIV